MNYSLTIHGFLYKYSVFLAVSVFPCYTIEKISGVPRDTADVERIFICIVLIAETKFPMTKFCARLAVNPQNPLWTICWRM